MTRAIVAIAAWLFVGDARAETASWSFASATDTPVVALRGPDGAPRTITELSRIDDGRVAIAIVFNGQRSWISGLDDDFVGGSGAHSMLVEAFRRLDLPRTLPATSDLVVLSYADGVTIREPLGPASSVTRPLIGSPKDYFLEIGADAVRGIHVGLNELSQSTATKKYLVVLGDGTVMNPDNAARDLSRLRRDADMLGVEIAVFIVKSALSEPSSPIRAIADRAFEHVTADTIVEGLRGMLAASAYRWTLRFALEPWMYSVAPTLVIDGAPAPERGRELPPK